MDGTTRKLTGSATFSARDVCSDAFHPAVAYSVAPALADEKHAVISGCGGRSFPAGYPRWRNSCTVRYQCYHQLSKFDQHTIHQLMERLLFQQDHKEKERLRHAYMPLCRYEEPAAGIGVPMLDYAENETVYVLQANVPHGTDGIIHVNGRSMEPTFRDGSYVYVDSSVTVQPGQIGIFVVNGEAFIKEYQPDGLYSHNCRYKPICTGEGVKVRCCERVMGAVGEGDVATGSLLERIETAFAEEGE